MNKPRSFFSRLLGGSDEGAAAHDQPATSPRAALTPTHSMTARTDSATSSAANPANDDANAFVRREALLDRKERIAGYEFSLRVADDASEFRRGGGARRSYDLALITRLQGDTDSLLGQRLAFLRLAPESLHLPALMNLPVANTVLIIDGPPPGGDWVGTGERVAELKERGFSFGMHLRSAEDARSPLLPSLDYLQVAIAGFDGFALQDLIRHLPKPIDQAPRLIASHVESHDDFLFCVKCSFDLFQGPFVTKHDSWRPTRGGINRSVAMPILSMVRGDAEFGAIAEQLKREPTLTYKLLRYLNSPAVGLQRKIDNLTHALVVIGRDKFYRWMSLLLFHFEKAGYRERMLTEQALVRGRTLELLAGKGRIPACPEQLFLIGLFSLLDIALAQPLPDLLKQAVVPDAVREALLSNTGVLAEALHLAILGEADSKAAPMQFEAALARCGLSDAEFSPVAAQALVWANEIVDAGGE